MKKKIKDLTIDEVKQICKKARTKQNGKVVQRCVSDCPLNSPRADIIVFDTTPRTCELVVALNKEIEVEEDEM